LRHVLATFFLSTYENRRMESGADGNEIFSTGQADTDTPTEETSRPGRRSPLHSDFWPAPALTGVFLLLFAATFLIVSSGAEQPTPESRNFVGSVEWLTWRMVAATAVVAFVILLASGGRLLRQRADHGLGVSQTRVILYLLAAAVPAVAGVAVVVASGGRNPALPVEALATRTRFVLFTGLLTAIPWLAIAWLCHDACRHRTDRSKTGSVFSFQELATLWGTLIACIGAFAVGVVTALITSGALRFAFLAAHPVCGNTFVPIRQRTNGTVCGEDFPASNVLLYGAVFAVFLLSLTLPLLAVWRSRALEWVAANCQLPNDGVPDKDWSERQNRLRAELHLNTSLLSNPLTVLSVFTPLITSVLAAFLPQLAT
jgi:hypothetical protein